MKTIIFDNTVFGHHLEYLHHLYEGALTHQDKGYVFAVPESFKTVSSKMEWKSASHISFRYFDEKKARGAWNSSKLLGRFVKEEKADEVFLITIMSFLPWLPFFIPSKVKVSGIVYLIYLYRWKTAGLKIKILDTLKYLLFSRCRVFHRIFFLNDKVAPRIINRLFKSNKFEYLPDPFALPEIKNSTSLRTELQIPEKTRCFLHFGGLTKRKGTLEILKAIKHCLDENITLPDYFIFAGKVYDDIKGEFYDIFNEVKKRGVHVLCFDKFCEYEFLCRLCASSDYLLIPYFGTAQSSGVIAYSAKFNIPVIGPKDGMIGRLIKQYKLGTCLSDVSAAGLSLIFKGQNQTMEADRNKATLYVEDNTVARFLERIYDNN